MAAAIQPVSPSIHAFTAACSPKSSFNVESDGNLRFEPVEGHKCQDVYFCSYLISASLEQYRQALEVVIAALHEASSFIRVSRLGVVASVGGTTLTGSVMIPKAGSAGCYQILTFNVGDSRTAFFDQDGRCCHQTVDHVFGRDPHFSGKRVKVGVLNRAVKFSDVLTADDIKKIKLTQIEKAYCLIEFKEGVSDEDKNAVLNKLRRYEVGYKTDDGRLVSGKAFVLRLPSGLAMTRSLGDFDAMDMDAKKSHPDFLDFEVNVITEPVYVISASDGVWDVMETEAVGKILKSGVNARDIVTLAQFSWVDNLGGCDATDDISVICGRLLGSSLRRSWILGVADGHGRLGELHSKLCNVVLQYIFPELLKVMCKNSDALPIDRFKRLIKEKTWYVFSNYDLTVALIDNLTKVYGAVSETIETAEASTQSSDMLESRSSALPIITTDPVPDEGRALLCDIDQYIATLEKDGARLDEVGSFVGNGLKSIKWSGATTLKEAVTAFDADLSGAKTKLLGLVKSADFSRMCQGLFSNRFYDLFERTIELLYKRCPEFKSEITVCQGWLWTGWKVASSDASPGPSA